MNKIRTSGVAEQGVSNDRFLQEQGQQAHRRTAGSLESALFGEKWSVLYFTYSRRVQGRGRQYTLWGTFHFPLGAA
jgi:hypothetical protein